MWSMTEKMEMLCRVLDLGHVVVMEQVCVEHDGEDGDAVSLI